MTYSSGYSFVACNSCMLSIPWGNKIKTCVRVFLLYFKPPFKKSSRGANDIKSLVFEKSKLVLNSLTVHLDLSTVLLQSELR